VTYSDESVVRVGQGTSPLQSFKSTLNALFEVESAEVHSGDVAFGYEFTNDLNCEGHAVFLH
jgi:hypothetical protein